MFNNCDLTATLMYMYWFRLSNKDKLYFYHL